MHATLILTYQSVIMETPPQHITVVGISHVCEFQHPTPVLISVRLPPELPQQTEPMHSPNLGSQGAGKEPTLRKSEIPLRSLHSQQASRQKEFLEFTGDDNLKIWKTLISVISLSGLWAISLTILFFFVQWSGWGFSCHPCIYIYCSCKCICGHSALLTFLSLVSFQPGNLTHSVLCYCVRCFLRVWAWIRPQAH